MPGCAAVGCNNRSEKGYIMKCFPRDPKLRKIWQERVARADWEPSNNSFLCHVHFEPQEWSITQSGRIRLKKNAVPSIFNITSTRKSPKKRIKPISVTKENISQNIQPTEYLENDTEYSSTGHIEDKESDFQDTDEPSLQSIEECQARIFQKIMEVEAKESNGTLCAKEDNDTKEHLIRLSDDNLIDIGSLVKQNNLEIQLNDKNKETGSLLMTGHSMNAQISNSVEVKQEAKVEIVEHPVLNDSYDEIEEKLKQICDGGSTEDEKCVNKDKLTSNIKDNNRPEENSSTMCHPCKTENTIINANHDASKAGEMDQMLTDNEENVETIFGTESGDERVNQSITHNKNLAKETDKKDDTNLEHNKRVKIKEEKAIFTEDIEENFTKDEVHVIPNIRAAMKRKRRTREEIMKSIKKSIKNTSDQELDSSHSDLSESIEPETEARNDLSTSPCQMKDISNDDTIVEPAKFVIKVTGDPNDVSEIIGELSANSIVKHVPQKFISPCTSPEDTEFVTSVITVYSPANPTQKNTNEADIQEMKDQPIASNTVTNIEPVNLDSVHSQIQSPCCRHSVPRLEDEDKNLAADTSSHGHCHMHRASPPLENTANPPHSQDYEDLLEKIKVQEDVISKLTDQLILFKELESSIKNKSATRELQAKDDTPTHKMNTRSSTAQSTLMIKKNLESKQRLIEDLSNRVNHFEETNKKLMKTVTLESQQKRKLEGQLKQKDNRIKELNWKLEKASKYLERAEKNTNTYRRKMLNMQTVMRRKKLLDEKMSKFNEMLIDSSKHEFSEKALAMAVEIRKTCGRAGYDKLLSFGFPLPPLPALRKRFVTDDLTDFNESDVEKMRNAVKRNLRPEKARHMKSETELDTKDSGVSEITVKTEFDGAETITGTVQDIFDENNDGDDFSTNELREHFILQLNAVM